LSTGGGLGGKGAEILGKLFTGSIVALSLAVAAVVILHPTRAKSEDTKTTFMEVRVDNFTFGPNTLTVPANSTVTWVNKDDVPHVIASNDGLFKSKALDTDDKYCTPSPKPALMPTTAAFTPRWWERSLFSSHRSINDRP
jgi:plastocyanin